MLDALSRLPINPTYYEVVKASDFNKLDHAFFVIKTEVTLILTDAFYDRII